MVLPPCGPAGAAEASPLSRGELRATPTGQAALEYLAVLVLAVAIVAVVVVGTQPGLRRWVNRTGGKIAALGEPQPSAVPTSEPPPSQPAPAPARPSGGGAIARLVVGDRVVATDAVAATPDGGTSYG